MVNFVQYLRLGWSESICSASQTRSDVDAK
jgi:hypothetical protein